MKKFIQLIIQEKMENDFHGFLICEDEGGTRWELRVSGNHPIKVTEELYDIFTNNSSDWDVYGYTVHKSYGRL